MLQSAAVLFEHPFTKVEHLVEARVDPEFTRVFGASILASLSESISKGAFNGTG